MSYPWFKDRPGAIERHPEYSMGIGIGIGIPFIGMGGGGAGAAQAVRFDGINDFYEIASTGPAGVADGTGATFGFWFKMEGGDGVAQTIFEVGTTTAHRLEVVRLATNTLRVISRTVAAVQIVQHVSASTFTVADGWNHALIDLNDTASIMRINGVAEGTNTPGVSGSIDLTNQYSIGHSDDPAAAELFDGCLADFWFVDESLGLTDDIAEQFYDTTLNAPRALGTNGTGPSANVLIYLNQADPNFHLNSAGTDFVETGAVEACDGPGNYSAQHVLAGFAPAVGWPGTTGENFQDANNNTGLADGKEISFSFWARRADTTSNRRIFESFNQHLQINASSVERLAIRWQTSAGATVFFWDTASNAMAGDDVWRHWCGYIDTAVLNDFDNFRNGVSLGESAITFTTDGVIDITDLGIVIGSQNNGNGPWSGGISQLAVWPRKIDWGVPSNLALVYGSGGEAIVLPDDGDIDGLGDAAFCFNKVLASAHLNGGTADDWATASAGLTDINGPAL